MLDGRRKSIQPMAARLPDGDMQALQHFVNQSPWDETPIRRRIAERLSEVVRAQAWIVDDVSFPKCGTASVAVAPQYCGALGKRANCQVAVTVHAATDQTSCPLQWRLFLPQEWAQDRERCKAAGVPDDVGHTEKWRLALEILDQLAQWQLQTPVILADAGYGQNTLFRLALQERALTYVLAARAGTVAHREAAAPTRPDYGGLGPPTLPRYRTPPRSLAVLATEDGRDPFTEVTWREGSKGPMTSRFRRLSVRPAGKQALRAAQEAGGGHYAWDGVLPTQSLLVEWPKDAAEPTDYWLTNLPAEAPIEDLVRLAKLRWRIEHDYRELKHGLGLDHFEGRSWRGWQHHVTLVTAAQAFITCRRHYPKAPTPD
jgi:SRSO17 transposase